MPKKRQPNRTFTPIGQVLDSILDRCRSESAGGILHLVHVWEKAVGPPISDNAKPFCWQGIASIGACVEFRVAASAPVFEGRPAGKTQPQPHQRTDRGYQI